MGAATIPAPNEHHIEFARISVTNGAQTCGLDLDDPKVQQFMEMEVAMRAQLDAEIMWLRNILNRNPGAGSEDLKQAESQL
jgi:hypothetical protein